MLKSLALSAVFLSSSAIGATGNIVLSADTWGDYINKDLSDRGVMSEIVTRAFAESQVTTSIKWVPWKRIETIEIDTHNAISYGWIKNPEREKRWLYSEPFFHSGDIFVTHITTGIYWQTLEDLKPYKIGVTRGYSHGEAFDSAKSWLNIEYANSDKVNLKKILARRVDLFAIDPKVASAEINKHFSKQANNFRFIYEPRISTWDTHLVCAKSNIQCADIIDTFNKGLAKLKASGQHKILIDNFLSIKPSQ